MSRLKVLIKLKELQAQGKGEDTMLLTSPDAPYHHENRTRLVFLDDMTPYARVVWMKYTEKVYDYPTMTLDKAIEKLEKGEDIFS